MVNLDLYLDFPRDRSESAELSLLVVVVRSVELRVLVGELNRSNQQVILLVGGVGAQNQSEKWNTLGLFK